MKKSKFLKKSLAMLLALMLVIAMIPLSASAALPDDLQYITVEGAQVSVDSLEVNVSSAKLDNGEAISIGTGISLSPVELWVYENGGSQLHDTATPTGKGFAISKYVDVSADKKTGTMRLALVDPTSTADRVLANYELKINFVAPGTTTNLAVVPNNDGTYGDGVYEAYVEGDKIIVVTARHNPTAQDKDGTAWTQTGVTAKITVRALDGAYLDISGNPTQSTINANNDAKVTVVSQASDNTRKTYTVVSKYVDALESFTITAGDTDYDAVIGDANNDDVPDTLTVTLPKSVVGTVSDPITSPTLPVSYSVNGNVNVTTDITVGGTSHSNVPTEGGKLTLTGLATVNKGRLEYNTINGTVTVTRLNDFKQQYNLVVKTEDSTNTAITYARVNSTEATVDGAAISAVLPVKYNGNPTNLGDVDVVLYTEDTVSKIVIGEMEAEEATGEANVPSGQKAWTWPTGDTIDVSNGKSVTITVYAESGKFEQYSLTASTSNANNTAGMSAVWMNVDGVACKGEVTGTNEYTITVPYMTTSLANAVLYATPTTGSFIVYNYSYVAGTTPSYTGTDIVNGQSTGTTVGQTGTLPVSGTSFKLSAVSMGDVEVHTDYTVKVVLETAGDGTVLTGLDFTAQNESTATDSDKAIYRAMEDGVNTFHAYVDQQSDGSVGLSNISIEVPKSLTTHTEDYTNAQLETYYNVVTDYETAEGGVAFVIAEVSGLNRRLESLDAITSFLPTVTGNYIGDQLDTTYNIYNQIVVLPEEVARTLITNGLPQDQSVAGDFANPYEAEGWASYEYLLDYGTIYNISVEVADAATGRDLESISVGDVDLDVSSTDDITGTIPWSYTISQDELATATADDAHFLTFDLSDYAAMRYLAGNRYYRAASNGDVDGNGTVDQVNDNNIKFLFVRNNDHSVTVYRFNGSNALLDNQAVYVRSEQRLDANTTGVTVSQTEYTFDLEWADPSKEAEITNFTLAGYTGVVTNTSENTRTITVRVPYGTSLTGLVAEFEKSLGSTVKIGSTSSSALDFISGVTSLNYTSDVTVYVTSEDGSVENLYTITVEEGLAFSDLNGDEWYYDNVMDAANNGYVSGYPDGTFKPVNSITRAEFASMIAKALGYDSNPEETPSAFPDVAEDYWAKAAINFCAQNGIISGYEDGEFKPGRYITRQEAAAILNNAFDLAEKYGISTEAFPDDSAIAGWAEDHVYAAKASGLMKGDAGTGNFRPTNQITRAEAASILMNANRAGLIK